MTVEDIELTKDRLFEEKFKFILKYPLMEGEGEPLPKLFKLKDPFPGEPPYMKMRTKPAVLRFHKFKAERDADAYWYSEALLYLPHRDEKDLQEKLKHAKANIDGSWDSFVTRISHVKGQVMEFLEDNEEARVMAAEMFIDNNLTGEFMDPEGEQENEEDRLDFIEQQADFQHLDPEFADNPPENVFEKQFKPIEVRPLQELRIEARKLDLYQRKVLEIGVKHARAIAKSRGGKNPLPETSPLVMVDGAAGSGKSCTINILRQFILAILQQPGDNPECPYVLLCAPTGTAAVNIRGQTLHTAFGFTWGDDHLSLSDKVRDTKRALFKNLKFLIIDEISMVKADLLYQIDLRLREIKMKPDAIFGGVALFVFGDVMQLKPVKGVYIWCKPKNADFFHTFSLQSHWEQFAIVSLVENHRQEGDKEYAEILNRIRVGESTEEDMQVLQARVRPENHSDLQGATVIASTHKVVNKYNKLCLDQLDNVLVEIEAINSHSNIPNYKPRIHDKRGTVGTTAYMQTLRLKVGCRVMLIDNIDVSDCLCNGSMGTLKAILRDHKGNIQNLMIQFDVEDSGREMRRVHPQLAKEYPGLTPIKKNMIKYSTSASAKGTRANTASVQQFPVIISFASTTHKIQGQTFVAPRKVAIDLRSVFGPNQAYVMMGRVQKQEQLTIIGSLAENKIYVDKNALDQLEIMKEKSINTNPPVWERSFEQKLKIYFHNIQSLRDKMEDIRRDYIPFYADVMIFAESWMQPGECVEDPTLKIENYSLSLNSIGRGRGLAVYFKESELVVTQVIKQQTYQITKLESGNFTVISLYRSIYDKDMTKVLKETIPDHGPCLIIGDFNLCTKYNPNHEIISALTTSNFKLIVSVATHIKGGHIDQAWLRCQTDHFDVQLYSPYYTCKDHDALLFSLYEPSSEKGNNLLRIESFINL